MVKPFVTTLCLLSLCGAVAFAANQEQPKKTKRPQVIQKDGKKASRRCFKDEDHNGFCDNGSEQHWKCKNNCRIDKKEVIKEKKRKDASSKELNKGDKKKLSDSFNPCSCCPNAGNCAGACFAMLENAFAEKPSV